MHCRAVLLLDTELRELEADPIWGISVTRLPNHPLLFFANLSGQKDSRWEKGSFHVTLFFNEHFNEEAPDVIFNTIPFHPNVHPESGKLCANFLDNSLRRKRKDIITVTNILLSIQEILSNPELDTAVNDEACQLLETKPRDYDKIVHQCVKESRNLQGALDTSILEKYTTFMNRETKPTLETIKPVDTTPVSAISPSKAKQVSFDVYHRSWVQVATTKPTSTMEDSEIVDEDRETLQMWNPAAMRSISPSSAIRVSPSRNKSPLVNRNSELSRVDQMRQKKQERIKALKKLYMNKTDDDPILPVPSTSMTDITSEQTEAVPAPSAEAWDREAEDLLAWTDSLDEKQV